MSDEKSKVSKQAPPQREFRNSVGKKDNSNIAKFKEKSKSKDS